MSEHMIIAGGGINGQVLALAAASVGLRVTLVDGAKRDAKPAADGRAYSLALTSVNVLRALGVWESVSEQAQPMLDIKVSEGRVGKGAAPFTMHFDHREIEEGPMAYLIEDNDLRPVLDQAVDGLTDITWLDGVTVEDHLVSSGEVVVTLSTGARIWSDLLVGCDGRGSKVATRTGLTRIGWQYPQLGLVTTIAHERPHHGVAHQFFSPSGILAVLPLRGHRSSIVWSEETPRAADIAALTDTDFLSALRTQMGTFLGEIELAGARFSYPLGLSLARSFVSERVALVGDAAHGVHPLAGQGLNLGIRDSAALVEVLAEAARRGEDIGRVQVLRRFERWRRPDAVSQALASDGLNRVYKKSNPLLSAARNIGMGVVNATPALRRGFMRQAAGLSGDLPKLMLGKPV